MSLLGHLHSPQAKPPLRGEAPPSTPEDMLSTMSHAVHSTANMLLALQQMDIDMDSVLHAATCDIYANIPVSHWQLYVAIIHICMSASAGKQQLKMMALYHISTCDMTAKHFMAGQPVPSTCC